MNKALVFSALTIGAAVILSPKVIGTNAHKNLKTVVAKINDKPGYSLEIKEEKMGWFGSKNKLHFAIDVHEFMHNLSEEHRARVSDTEMPDLSFDVDVSLAFGPFLGSNGAGLIAWDAFIYDKPKNLTILQPGIDYIYHMNGKASLSGGISYRDVIPEIEFTNEENRAKLHLTGLQGEAKPVDGDLEYSGALGSLTYSAENTSLAIEKLSLEWMGEFDLATLVNQKYGKFRTVLAMQGLTLTETGDLALELTEFSLFGDTKVAENEILDMAFGYNVKQLTTPFDKFSDIQLGFAFKNISGDFVREYQGMLMNIGGTEDPEAIFSALEKPFVRALAAKPEFHVTNIGFNHEAGELRSNASFKLSRYDVAANHIPDENFWLNNLLVDSSLSVSRSLFIELGQKILVSRYRNDPALTEQSDEEIMELAAQAIEPMLQGMKQQGLLVEDDNLLTLKMSVAEGQVNLNGNAIPLTELTARN